MAGLQAPSPVEAYQRHELTRDTRSLRVLFCVLALLDALDQGDSLRNLGLYVKMSHDDRRLYLQVISHASLAKRGMSESIGQASVYYMLSPEHRLYLPLSFLRLQLLVDMTPSPTRDSERQRSAQNAVYIY
jgi:hypothetical protein